MKFCYGYPDFPDASKSIEELSVPDECMKAMKRVGIQYVGDMLDVYARLPGHGFRMSLKCYSLVFREIIVLSDCPWGDEIKKWLANWTEES